MNQDWTSKTGSQFSPQPQAQWRTCSTCQLNVEPHVERCPRDGTLLADPSDAERLFEGRYEILSVIASGGMGTVYKAVQKALGKTVAIKMLKAQDSSNSMWSRFQQEARTASLLNHPNIIHIYDFGATVDGQPYMTMDFVEGTDLGTLIKTESKIRTFEAVQIFLQICDAMQHAHSRGVWHRDLKPSNIMLSNLTGIPEVKIVDFGIAKFIKGSAESQALTQTGEIFGSPYYMSPEQTVNKAVDHRSDIYSVGCIMYETLCGLVPISGSTAFETLMKHMSEKPKSLREHAVKEPISDELNKLVMKCLEKEAGKRFQTMDDLKEALLGTQEARGKPTGKKSHTFSAAEKKRIVIAACVIICLILGFFVLHQIFLPETHNKLAETFELQEAERNRRIAKAETDFGVDPQQISDKQKDDAGKNEKSPSPAARLQDPVGFSCTNEMLARNIESNPKINNLVLLNCDLTDAGIKPLSQLRLLRLQVSQCPKITTAGWLEIINSQPHLQTLEILNAGDETKSMQKVFLALSRLPEFKALRLENVPGLEGNDLKYLPKNLQSLSLAHNNKVETPDFANLSDLTKLSVLNLSETLTSGKEVGKLKKLVNLTSLSLNSCPVTDEAMDYILNFKKLEKLELKNTFISRQGLFKLAALHSLRVLDITHNKADINDDDVATFMGATNLRCSVYPHMKNNSILNNGSLTD